MKNKNHIDILISSFSKKFDKKLVDLIPKNKISSKRLYDAMKYIIDVGGKRLRPIFLTEISNLLELKKKALLGGVTSVELIHCYSLVHDDLPSMDNDDLRRGHKTCHKRFDEASDNSCG